ncbi:MAG: flagellar hook-basal body complex protein FliE [Oscillospiraceae bacterium]|nr:flagellar hook-basal body complex protein FliE [Oscillospiraceae bacterium]
MFIVPISSSMRPIESLFEDDTAAGVQDQNKPQFSDVFKEVFSEMQETQRVVQEDSLRLAMGEIDDLHTIYNNMTKASVAVDTFVAVKDAVVNAYDRIIQMSM